MVSSLHTIQDRSADILKGLKMLADLRVAVGVPEDRASRDDGGPITNAALAYIHDKGSPARNIPARPFMGPGIHAVENQITQRLVSAGKAAIDGKPAIVMQQLQAAGQEASSSIQNKITDGSFEPLAPATVARRRAKLEGTTALTQNQREQGFRDIRPLVDTGQLRASITWVIRNRGRTVVEGQRQGASSG